MEFRFAHVADTHLGCNWPQVPDRRQVQGPVYVRAFEKCIDEAIDRDVDFVLHAGDLVDKPQPTVPALRSIFSEMRKLEAKRIPFIITRGTHDYARDYFEGGSDILTVLDEEKKVMYVEASSPKPYCDVAVNSSRIRVYGLGDYGETQKEKLIDFSSSFTRDADFNILLMHGGVADLPYNIGAVLRVKELRGRCTKIDYFAMGHDHHRFEFPDDRVYNPGSTEYCSFKEAPVIHYLYQDSDLIEVDHDESRKGFYVVNVIDDKIETEFIEIPSRRVITIQVEFDEATPEEVLDGTSRALQLNQDSTQIIRPVIKGTLASGHRPYEIRVKDILQSAVGLYVDRPVCSFPDRTLEDGQSGFDMSYTRILEQYFVGRGRSEETAKRLAALAFSLVRATTSRTMSQAEALETAIALVEKFELEGGEQR